MTNEELDLLVAEFLLLFGADSLQWSPRIALTTAEVEWLFDQLGAAPAELPPQTGWEFYCRLRTHYHDVNGAVNHE